MTHVFEEVNARAAAIGERLIQQAIEKNDIESVRKIRQLVDELYGTLIELAKSKPDYPTWHAALMKLNNESPFIQLDTTGEFGRIVEELGSIDATGYYFEQVMPVMKNGEATFTAERAAVLASFDDLIVLIANQRRGDMTLVE